MCPGFAFKGRLRERVAEQGCRLSKTCFLEISWLDKSIIL